MILLLSSWGRGEGEAILGGEGKEVYLGGRKIGKKSGIAFVERKGREAR